MNRQTTNRVLMVRPVRFAFNEETAANNAFQQKSRSEAEARCVQQQAVAEFDAYVALLRQNGVMVDVLQDTPEPFTTTASLRMWPTATRCRQTVKNPCSCSIPCLRPIAAASGANS